MPLIIEFLDLFEVDNNLLCVETSEFSKLEVHSLLVVDSYKVWVFHEEDDSVEDLPL